MNRKKSSKNQKVAGEKPKGKGGPVIFEDGPIIIKGSSVSIGYKRNSFRPRGDFNDHKDNGTANEMTIKQVTVMNDDTGETLYAGSPGPHCTIYVYYS